MNGGPRRLFAHTSSFYPAFVQEVVPIRITSPAGRRWGQELRFDVPVRDGAEGTAADRGRIACR